MQTPKIIITDNGFAIVTAKATDAVSFDEVSAIVAYKLDELTTDLVCCDIVTGAGDGKQIRTIHEELPGFDAAMKRFESLPGFDRAMARRGHTPALHYKPNCHLQQSRQRLIHSQTDPQDSAATSPASGNPSAQRHRYPNLGGKSRGQSRAASTRGSFHQRRRRPECGRIDQSPRVEWRAVHASDWLGRPLKRLDLQGHTACQSGTASSPAHLSRGGGYVLHRT